MKTIKDLKAEQKTLAEEIRSNKTETKKLQKAGKCAGYHQAKQVTLRWQYRHGHIAYCMLRGRKYEEIERSCRTEPVFDRINRIMETYAQKEQCTENVCAGA